MARDTRERGRTEESVSQQYEATVRPMAEAYVWPQRAFADLGVSGTHHLQDSVDAVYARLAAVSD